MPSCHRWRCAGPVLTIRKFPERAFLMQDLINLGSLSMDAAVFLEALVRGKISMVVVGGTGTGKTTMLNVLSNFIPDGERLITIEESAELQIQGAHVVTLETRPANAEGTGRSASATWSATHCVCGPTGSSSVSAEAPRPSTCSRP